MGEGDVESVQRTKASDIDRAFHEASGGLVKATQNKLSEYTLRVLKGEPIEDLMQGLPQSWVDEIKSRATRITNLKDEEEAWKSIQGRVEVGSSFDRKAFKYGWQIIHGAGRQEVLQGLPPSICDRVDTYINETFRLAVETVPSDKQEKTS